MKKPEVWMRGPVPEVPAILQPAAHALLQSVEEVETIVQDFDDKLLWSKPAGMASVGFHLKHLCGVVDRLFTYARGASLTPQQLEYLEREGIPGDEPSILLARNFSEQVDRAINQLKQTPDDDLLASRGIGRKQIPTNVLGLLFHAAEHTQRHVGQLLVTVQWVKNEDLLR
ncbi:MAG: DinB family protein [Chryseolinea sp.]